VELHGGRIWADSNQGEGSNFHIAFPIVAHSQPTKEHQKQATRALPPSELDHRLVLCVDNDEGVTTLFRRYLGKQGYQVVALTDSSSAVEKARQLKPFAITLDVKMPNKDGWQILRELKTNPDTRDIPVIMCTIAREQGQRSLGLGATDCLIKPILEEELLSALQRLEGEPSGTADGAGAR
jgi:CheY-like chemotaxis protein